MFEKEANVLQFFSQFFQDLVEKEGGGEGGRKEKKRKRKMERENVREIAIYSGKALLPAGKGRPNHEIIRH